MSDGNGQSQDHQEEPQSQFLPKQPGQKLSLMAAQFLAQIQNGNLNPQDLDENKRRLCVAHLLHDGRLTQYEIAAMLGVCTRTVLRDKKYILEQNAVTMLAIDEADIVVQTAREADFAIARLKGDKKYKEAWTVWKECVEKLQEFGYLKKVPQQHVVGSLLEMLEFDKQQSSASGAEPSAGFKLPLPERVEGFKN